MMPCWRPRSKKRGRSRGRLLSGGAVSTPSAPASACLQRLHFYGEACSARAHMPTDLPNDDTSPDDRYAYKASLIGSAHQFELTGKGLSWKVGGRSGVWAYSEISSISLSYRPMTMQSRRFRADISRVGGGRIKILSTTWQTVSLMAPQDHGYRAFITGLHRRMAAAGSRATLTGGLSVPLYAAAIVMVGLLAIAM